ncbi:MULTISPECIES: 7-carboxy-7-deazaguanine synthase QueE [Geobacillus]|uniref:7-carboxy-7-deazaguanine synthase n=1 Tax=Geobacillus thermocatenulatus TaxID=33938 RepID=A0A226Q4P9_9BACL|nr:MULTISPECIES: 7-carboxy-7-deazaguanine synthase QueE [Geobacillus]AST00144.1 7-carboxy-7-deazaguanine synthase QueE [Geobacillus thermocatenulatus]KLR72345.1 7-carboxy-7-deazaguanine synthase [Geobacillus sp. T6]OXB86522.1 7-carboxy-7-deazaguanine synthase QueE [Geobacillus thermocatenulatus]
MARTIPVLEIFGPTIQGEGMVIGQKTMFVRTAGCDYRCRWCDSAFTWDGSAKDEIEQLTADDIWRRLEAMGGRRFRHVTISGGNPLLIAALGELIALLHEKGMRVAVETQGSRWQDWLLDVDDITISPKPPSSGMDTDWSALDPIMERLQADRSRVRRISLKVVVFDDADLAYAKEVHRRYPGVPFYLQAGNADVADSDVDALRAKLLSRLEWLVEQAADSEELADVHILPQLHTLLWGNKRGV